jgi:hypothetical protein
MQVFWTGAMAPAPPSLPQRRLPGRPVNGSRERGVGEGAGASSGTVVNVLVRQARAFVPRVSRKTCTARQHRRHIRALSYQPCSSCITRQASPSGARLSCHTGPRRVRWRPPPPPVPFPSAVKPGRPPTSSCRALGSRVRDRRPKAVLEHAFDPRIQGVDPVERHRLYRAEPAPRRRRRAVVRQDAVQ